MSIRTRLQLYLTLISIALIVGVSGVLYRGMIAGARDRIEVEFKSSLATLNGVLGFRLKSIQDTLLFAVSDSLFRSQAAESETPAAGERAHEVFASADLPILEKFPVLAIFNAKGTLLYTKARPSASGTPLPSSLGPFFQNILRTGRGTALWWNGDPQLAESGLLSPPAGASELYLVTGVPIAAGNSQFGVVIAGEPVSAVLLGSTPRSVGAQIGVADPAGHLSLTEALRPEAATLAPLLAATPSDAGERATEFRIGSDTHFILTAPLRAPGEAAGIGRAVLVRSLDSEIGPLLSILRLFLLFALAAAVLLSVGTAFLFALRFTEPILVLRRAVRAVQGGDLSVQVPVAGQDEVAQLTHAFNKMIESLREKAVLEKLNAKLKAELQAAREIQRALLPPESQKFPGAELEALYHPCDELSGDFFDSYEKNGMVYFYLADVTSHGTAAAQVTYLLKELFQNTLANLGNPALPELLTAIRVSYAAHKLRYDVGIQAARYDFATRSFEYVRGNAPSALRTGKGGPQALGADPGPAISAASYRAEDTYTVSKATLDQGESVFLFTDGSYEFEIGPSRAYGMRQLSKLLFRYSSGEWKTEVLSELSNANHGMAFDDDLTILRFSVLAERPPTLPS